MNINSKTLNIILPNRIGGAEIIEGADLNPVITDDFILVPNPRTCNPERDYIITFRIQKDDMEVEEDSQGGSAIVRCRDCGEIAARPGMVVEMDGEAVDVSGEKYDADKGFE